MPGNPAGAPLSDLPSLTWQAAWARRLERSGLAAPLLAPLPGIVRAMCGAHAQVMAAAELSIALRTLGVTGADVRRALWEERSLVKTYGPRGTVHLLPAQDLPLWTAALGAAPLGVSASVRNQFVTPEQAEAIIAAIAVVLAEAELTADELTEALVGQVGAWAGERVMPAFDGLWPRWRIVQDQAGMRGALIFGPNRGRNVTYTSPRRWLPGFQPAEARQALAELVRSYLHTYGPATPQQFAQWLAVPRGWAVELFESLAGQLEQVDVEGSPAWVAAGDSQFPAGPPQGVRLLPYFDAYVVGCHPRQMLYPGAAAGRAMGGGQSGNFPVLLIDGVVAGVWQQRRSGKKLAITVEPLQELSAAQRSELDAQAVRLGEILEAKPELALGAVTTGRHA